MIMSSAVDVERPKVKTYYETKSTQSPRACGDTPHRIFLDKQLEALKQNPEIRNSSVRSSHGYSDASSSCVY